MFIFKERKLINIPLKKICKLKRILLKAIRKILKSNVIHRISKIGQYAISIWCIGLVYLSKLNSYWPNRHVAWRSQLEQPMAHHTCKAGDP